jgi:hypothetical protein
VDSEKESLQRIYDGVPIYFTTDNTESGTTMQMHYTAGELGLNLSGMGMMAGVGMAEK